MADVTGEVEGTLMRHRVGFTFVACFLLFVLVLLPFALTSVFSDLRAPPSDHLYELTPAANPASSHSRLHLDIVSFDEWGRTATIRVSGNHICPAPCDHGDRVLLVSIPPSTSDGEGLPPSEAITFPGQPTEVSKDIKLPVSGQPIRYPFDTFRLTIGTVVQRVYSDGTIDPLSAADARGHLFLSLHMQSPRMEIANLQAIPPASVYSDGDLYQYFTVNTLTFQRPLYLKVLTVLLVLLVSAAAAFAVFMRPLDQLVINSGALVLGVWGIRSILLGTDVPGITAVDLSLSVVILFLLAAITVRAALYLQRRSGINPPARVLHPRGHSAHVAAGPEAADKPPAPP